ncbi:hypothetical protein PsorP6_002399 [Peronosclerospora sorghi]|uniref:Uncharacterized protein n=1 Tax=Peronosclerospora sorghi TaxID=230839 RepID=A0ACC0WUT5_9STRA|nr:hypothetical protein PsorP6_002399 [Peronosclerospora sorghi]
MILEAPQDAEYDTANDARDDIASFAESEGYAVKVGKSRTVGNKEGSELKNFELLCFHGGKHTPKGEQVRNRTIAVLIARLKFVSNDMVQPENGKLRL